MSHIKTSEIIQTRKKFLKNKKNIIKSNNQNHFVCTVINKLITKNSKLLDIGCGDAKIRKKLNCVYHGLDPIIHKNLINDFIFYNCDIFSYSLKTRFDFILIKDSVNYFVNIEVFLNELQNLLKKDGSIIFTEYVGYSYNPYIQVIKNFIKKYLFIRTNIWDKTYKNFYSSIDIIKYALRLKFEVKYSYYKKEGRYFIILFKNKN